MIVAGSNLYWLGLHYFLMNFMPSPIMNTWQLVWEDSLTSFDASHWQKATHTFKNNLAQFSTDNISFHPTGMQLSVLGKKTPNRAYTAGEYRSLGYYHYGKFSVKIKPIDKKGIVTGFFLYDDSKPPHHEIDIEFLGKDCSKIFLNYWDDASKEYPTHVALTFDATNEFHEYTIEWMPTYIKWYVDGKEVHTVQDNIPDKPQKVMMNTWISPHKNWAGKFHKQSLPLTTFFKDFKYYVK